MSTLYPLRFKPIYIEKLWGGQKIEKFLSKQVNLKNNLGESWEISAVEGNISVVENGFLRGTSLKELIKNYKSDLLGNSVYKKFNEEFPLLVKYIDAREILSVQVHPDDEYARKNHNSNGKNEMWYIIDAEKNSEIVYGFKENINKDIFIKHLNNSCLTEILNFIEVEEGDVFFIPARKLHAIGKGILLAEIQQSSDLTYRVYDWNRVDLDGSKRELHTDLALDVLDFEKSATEKPKFQQKLNSSTNLVSSSFFDVNILWFENEIERDYNNIDSFIIYMCVDGGCDITCKDTKTTLNKGDTLLLPAIIKKSVIKPHRNCKMLETFITVS